MVKNAFPKISLQKSIEAYVIVLPTRLHLKVAVEEILTYAHLLGQTKIYRIKNFGLTKL